MWKRQQWFNTNCTPPLRISWKEWNDTAVSAATTTMFQHIIHQAYKDHVSFTWPNLALKVKMSEILPHTFYTILTNTAFSEETSSMLQQTSCTMCSNIMNSWTDDALSVETTIRLLFSCIAVAMQLLCDCTWMHLVALGCILVALGCTWDPLGSI